MIRFAELLYKGLKFFTRAKIAVVGRLAGQPHRWRNNLPLPMCVLFEEAETFDDAKRRRCGVRFGRHENLSTGAPLSW